jgi:hypothetical protein
MEIELPEEGALFWNVLRVVSDNTRTTEDIWKEYTHKHPRQFWKSIVIPPPSLSQIEAVLLKIDSYGFVIKGVTRFTDRALKEDARTYCLSDKGRSALLLKSGKKKGFIRKK